MSPQTRCLLVVHIQPGLYTPSDSRSREPPELQKAQSLSILRFFSSYFTIQYMYIYYIYIYYVYILLLTTLSYFDPSPTCFLWDSVGSGRGTGAEWRHLRDHLLCRLRSFLRTGAATGLLPDLCRWWLGGDGRTGGIPKKVWKMRGWEPDPVQNFKRSMVPLVPIWVWYCVHNLPLKKGDFPDVRGRPGSPASKGQLQFDLWSLGRFSTRKTGTTGKDFLTGWTSRRDRQVKRYLHHPKQLPK